MDLNKIIVAAAKENNCYDRLYAGTFTDGFKAGVEWSRKEFIKSLWHDASEEPEQLSLCIVYGVFPYKDREQIEDYFISYFTPYGWTDDYFPRNHTYTIKRWAYLDDILPEKGGKR